MKTVGIFLRSSPTKAEFQEYIRGLPGGRWQSNDRGLVSENNANVFIDYVENVPKQDTIEGEELAFIHRRLGQIPKLGVAMNIGHAEGAVMLAQKVAEAIASKYDGWIYDDEGVFGPPMGPEQ